MMETRISNAANETTAIGGGLDWVDPVYDNAGNMTSGPKASINNPTGTNQAELTRLHFVYDPWNRLVEVKNDSGGSPGSTERPGRWRRAPAACFARTLLCPDHATARYTGGRLSGSSPHP